MAAGSATRVRARDARADQALRASRARLFGAAATRARARGRLALARARPHARRRRRVGLRQEHARAPDRDARDADRRARVVIDGVDAAGADAATRRRAAPDACRWCSRTRSRASTRGRRSARRSRSRSRSTPTLGRRRARSARPGDAGPRRPRARALPALSAHVLGRPAPARRDRARADARAAPGRRRRAGLGARRLDPGAGAEPADGPAGIDRRRLRLHLAQPRGRRADRRRGHRDVPRPASWSARRRRTLFATPRHPYTRALLASTPRVDAARGEAALARAARSALSGELPSPLAPPSGCVFRTRCPYAIASLRRGRAAARAGRRRCTRRPASARTRSADGTRLARAGCSGRSRTGHVLDPFRSSVPRSTRSSATPCRSLAAPSDDGALIDLLAGARFVLIGEASHGTHDFYRERAAHHPPPDREQRLRRGRGRGRLARRLPRQPLRARRGRRRHGDRGARRLQALPGLDVAQHRRRSSSSTGCATTTTGAPGRAQALASTASTSTACSRRSRRCSPTSTRSTRRRRSARATATPASTTSPRTARPTATRRASSSTRAMRAGGRRRSCASCSRARRRCLARRGDGDEDAYFYAEQNARLVKNAEEYYRTMFSGARVVVEPARPPHGRDARPRSTTTSTARRGGRPKIVVWAHNSHLGDARATEMGERGELNVGQLVRERLRRATRCWSASPPTTAPSRRRRDWDDAGRAQAGAARPRRAATRRSSTTSAAPRFLLILRGNGDARASARGAAPAARDRRHLPARDRAPEPLLPRAPAAPVRRADPPRRDARAGAARPAGRRRRRGGRAARDLSLGRLRRRVVAPPGARRPASAKSVATAAGTTLKQCRP